MTNLMRIVNSDVMTAAEDIVRAGHIKSYLVLDILGNIFAFSVQDLPANSRILADYDKLNGWSVRKAYKNVFLLP